MDEPVRSARELFQLFMAHKAAAEQCEAALKSRALDAFEKGDLASGPLPGLGRVELRFSQGGPSVVPELEQQFLMWLRERMPDEVVVVFKLRDPGYAKLYLGQQATPVDPDELGPGEPTFMVDKRGEVIPGVKWTKGGRLETVALTRDSDMKRRLDKAAHGYARGTGPMLGLTAGEGSGKNAGGDPAETVGGSGPGFAGEAGG